MHPFRLIFSLFLASLLSQFPTFSEQYINRLDEKVHVLTAEVKDFDKGIRTASASDDMDVVDMRRERMRMTEARLENAEHDMQVLTSLEPVQRITRVANMRDPETLRETWLDFQPKIPVSGSGLILALLGFAAGWVLATLTGLLLRRPGLG